MHELCNLPLAPEATPADEELAPGVPVGPAFERGG